MIAYGQYKGRRHDAAQPVFGEAEPRPNRRSGGRKRVVMNGREVYDSISECARVIGCSPDTLSSAIRDGRPCHGQRVEYAEMRGGRDSR